MASSELLPEKTQMGAGTLWVANLDAMITHYRDGVGLSELLPAVRIT